MANIQVPPAAGTSGQFLDAIIITSSSLRQIVLLGDPATSGAFATVTTSAGMAVNVTSGSISTLTSGPVTISGTVTVLSASSGLVQISGSVNTLSSGPILLSSVGVTQSIHPVMSSAGFGPVTSSAGVLGSLSSGTVTLSSQITVTATGPVTVTSGTVTLSSNPTVISASSGVVQALFPVMSSAGFGPVTSSAGVLASLSSGTIIMSSVQSVTATFATNPWSSVPGFNMPIVSASSGFIQIIGTPLINVVGTSSGVAVVTTSGGLNTNITNTLGPVSSSWGVTIVISTGAYGGVTSTFFVLTSIQPVKASAGLLMGYSAYSSVDVTGGLVLRFYDMTTGNVTLGTSMKLIAPIPGLNSTGTVATVNPAAPVWFGPNGIAFGTAISVDAGVSSTGAITASSIFLTAFYL